MVFKYKENTLILVIRRWRNPGFSLKPENFDNVCVMLQKTMEYLNTIKRYSGRLFIKFERDESSFENSFYVCSIRIFTKFLGDPYYEPLVWFMMKSV